MLFHFLYVILKVNLSDTAAERESRVSEIEAELSRAQAICSRLSQVSTVV